MNSRQLAALVAAPVLISGMTVGITALGAAPASAACASGLKVSSVSTKASAKPQVSVAPTSVRRKSAKKKAPYVASAVVKASYGTASATVTDTLCTGDDAARVLTWNYSATGAGTFAKSVSATAPTKAAAKKKLAKSVASAKKSIATTAMKNGKTVAASNASRAAMAKAAGLSHVVYLTVSGEGESVSTSKVRPAGAMGVSQTPDGTTKLAIPADYSDETIPCLTKASTWPTASYLVDSGVSVDGATVPGTPAVTFSDQAALNDAVASELEPEVDLLAIDLAEGAVDSMHQAAFIGWSDNGDGVAVRGGDMAPPVTERLTCFLAFDVPEGTVSIHGLRVASAYQVSSGAGGAVINLVKPVKVKIG